jgi:hypothetical protein
MPRVPHDDGLLEGLAIASIRVERARHLPEPQQQTAAISEPMFVSMDAAAPMAQGLQSFRCGSLFWGSSLDSNHATDLPI